jgi:GAF domain-containing protein
VPIFDAERIIGALDVQSRSNDAFDAERVRALQAMANVLGTSIRNARLFEAQERTAVETRRVLDERETQLRQIQRLNQQLTRSNWREYIREHAEISGVTVEGDRIVYDDTWTDSLMQAGQVGEPVIEQRAGSALVAVPVKLGDEVIGVIEAETQAEGQSETIEMIQAVAQRLAISLDKARLFEETQNATAQEQRISEIVARYQTVTNVDDLLHITLTELSDSLGAQRGAIRLSLQPSSLNGEAGHD